MAVVARAPGKMAVLGEYAVLDGGTALVMAVDRYCRATVKLDERGSITTFAPQRRRRRTQLGRPSGIALVDIVIERYGETGETWSAEVDSREFYAHGTKLGLGSSAAALCAFAAAWQGHRSAGRGRIVAPSTVELIELHRQFQGGAGSGLDVAASVTGGVISFRLDRDGKPQIGSVPLPNSVGFAGIFTGMSASTRDFVAQFNAWRRAEPARSEQRLGIMRGLADEGCNALRAGDIGAFLNVITRYGEQLDCLGEQIGRAIVTPAHRQIARLAEQFGIAYKVSGAGGGDLGIALGCDREALIAFGNAVRALHFDWIDLTVARNGLVVEELV